MSQNTKYIKEKLADFDKKFNFPNGSNIYVDTLELLLQIKFFFADSLSQALEYGFTQGKEAERGTLQDISDQVDQTFRE